MNSRLHVLADALGRPIRMFLSAGQTSDNIGARALLASIPQAGMPLADRGCDADWFCNALTINYIHLCMPSRKGDKATDGHDKNRLTTDAPSACVLAATVIYWVSVRSRRP